MSNTTTGDSPVDEARAKTQEIGGQARSRVRDEVDRRSTEAGEQAGSAAQALREASDRLRQDGKEPVGKGIEQVAQRVERAGGWLREADGDTILRDVEDFGRRNPLAVVAAGLAVGFAASRLLKASSRGRYEESRGLGVNGRPAAAAARNPVSPREGVAEAAARNPVSPREGVPEGGLTGGTPATQPGRTPAI